MEVRNTYADDQVYLQHGKSPPTRQQQAEISFKAGYEKCQQDIIAKHRQPNAGNVYTEAGIMLAYSKLVFWC